ncbi:MAG: acetylxylan esterase, partial [Gemmatimonadota bacterium]|nr:acetylxylan esterase [Gemmatimonadota bacterium]
SESDIYLPCLYFKPMGMETFPTVILVDSEGKTADGGELAKELVSAGYGVFAVDLRGMGETRLKKNERDSRGGFQAQTLGIDATVAYDGLRLGRSVFAMRVYDLIRVADYVLSRKEMQDDGAQLAVIGKSSCGPVALYAAALEERIKGVLVDSSLVSFRELTRPEIYYYNFVDFLPGVLSSHDMPQVAAALAPGPCWILNPLDLQKKLKGISPAKESYSFSESCFQALGAKGNFKVRGYSTPGERTGIYLEWADRVFR